MRPADSEIRTDRLILRAPKETDVDALYEMIDELARTIVAIAPGRPILVAIEGRSAAGKSTFARELGNAVRRLSRPVLACSIDDFHPLGHKQRSIARAYTPESFVEEGYAYAAVLQQVLDPLLVGEASQ